MPPKIESGGSRIAVRTKVKSGCRTCKIRKVKCDESRPACYRCSSSGRTCDGYGIWDDSNRLYRQRQTTTRDSCLIPRLPVTLSVLVANTEDMQCFEWFKCRTATKLPGTFDSELWKTLLFQASLEEPSVLHAVLALGSIHRTGTVNSANRKHIGLVKEEQEQFALRHYVRAIGDLRPHFSARNRASVRVALLACVVFVYLELLRGHFKTAQMHLQKGIEIMKEGELLSKEADGVFRLRPCRESADNSIVEAFARLHLQTELLKYTHQHPCLVLHGIAPDGPVLVFHSFKDAWRELGRLLNKIFHLTHLAREQQDCQSKRSSAELIRKQSLVQSELLRWLKSYEAMAKALRILNSPVTKMVYELLQIHHTMSVVMSITCLTPNDTLAFDSCTNQFVLLIRLLANQWLMASKAPKAASPLRTLPGHLVDMSKSIVDMGWIPPLYYTAVNCRVHRIRLQAVRLLESVSHREGIWDSKTAACVARKVMDIEEGDFYDGIDKRDDFTLASLPSLEDLSFPTLPEGRRIQEVEVVMSGTPLDELLLFCKRKREGGDRASLVSRYNVQAQRWTDVME